MSNRVLFNTAGLTVSKPGFDVFTAAPKDMSFSTGKFFGVYMSYIAVVSVSVDGSGNRYWEWSYPPLSFTPIIFVYAREEGAGIDYFKQPAYTWDDNKVYVYGLPGYNTFTMRVTIYYSRA